MVYEVNPDTVYEVDPALYVPGPGVLTVADRGAIASYLTSDSGFIQAVQSDIATQATAEAAYEAAGAAAAAVQDGHVVLPTGNDIPTGYGGGLSEQDAAKLNTILTQALLISSGKLSIINPFLAGKVLVIVKDDDYLADKDRTITIPPDVWIDPTGANIKLHCLDLESEKDIVIIDGSADAEKERYNFNPSQAQTSLLKRTGIGHYQWAVKYHYDAGMFTILLGPLIVK